MKAISRGTEIFVKLQSMEELSQLESQSLFGMLKYTEIFSNNDGPTPEVQIPFSLKIDYSQREEVNVILSPQDAYIAKADNISFFINHEYYELLKKENHATARFWLDGKLKTTLENIK
ncbi:MAG: hypothetical protein QT05_C0050G0014 [archaeon GW2011_AR13]|nr:MAG: hypothetical protein QT05_C0050G0014 [archaeon GW2011_AR13]HIG94717.1 hypothetical protein [Nanoarchaeota archaeon]HIH63219.1 hypothetical protein [Nanoarchaeota archaeon]HIJ09323.1 hypothetical protein [Nanoarchaeota archaeon]